MKKLLLSAAVAAALAVPTAASAGTEPDGLGYCTDSETGCLQSGALTGSCAGHGGFGAFGKNWNFAGGADGQATGFFNSALCGNGGGGTPQ